MVLHSVFALQADTSVQTARCVQCPVLQDVKMVAWHPSGELLVSASYDDTVKLWVDSGDDWECVQTLSGSGVGHTSTVWGVAFSADGGRLVTCSDDLSLKFWSCQLGPGECWLCTCQALGSRRCRAGSYKQVQCILAQGQITQHGSVCSASLASTAPSTA